MILVNKYAYLDSPSKTRGEWSIKKAIRILPKCPKKELYEVRYISMLVPIVVLTNI
jgi:hypothetical protein